MDFGKLWEALGGFGIGRYGKALAVSGRLCKALDALESFGGFKSLWHVWKALGSFSTVCPSPRLWKALRCFGRLWDALEVFGGYRRL